MARKRTLASLGAAVKARRGVRKLRETAEEIKISAATLMRVENGRIPDLETFGKLCRWLGIDPAEFLGIPQSRSSGSAGAEGQGLVMSAHFRADKTPNKETIKALATMLLTAAGAEIKTQVTPDGDA